MLPDEDLRLLVHLDDEQGQGPVALITAAAVQDLPELLPVHGVVGLLEVDEGREVPPRLPLSWVDLCEEFRDVGGSGGTLLEAGLIDPCLQKVGGQRSHLGHDGLLQDLGYVGPHHDGSYVFKFCLVLALVL